MKFLVTDYRTTVRTLVTSAAPWRFPMTAPQPGQPVVFRNATVLTMDNAHTVLDNADVLIFLISPDFLASGSEWRTPPLWGIGLTQTITPGTSFLHDGRARSFEEAIMWHGGEAQAAHDAFQNASQSDREALTAFLSTL